MPKYAPFETEDELRLVYGATVDLLAGDDLNRNGVLDANEKNSTGAGEMNCGLFEYTTVYTREPNFHSDGSSLTNVNTHSRNAGELRTFLQNADVSSGVNANGLFNSIYSSGTGPANPCRGILDFALRCQAVGMNETDFAKIYNDVTTSTNTYLRGRVNVNTAGADVLTALFMGLNVDEQTASGAAQSLITYRAAKPGQPQHRLVAH